MKNVCITGYGAIGPIHAAAVNKCENANLYAVCDNNSAGAEKAGREHGVKIFDNYDKMLLDINIDAVHICTPHYLHFEMAKKAIMCGKSVVIEKPVTMTKAELDELSQMDGDISVVFQNRLNPCFVKLKEITDSKAFGKVIGAKGILTWHRDAAYYASGAWRGKWATEGGGVLINQAIHLLDLMCLLLGNIESVSASISDISIPGIEVEDTCVADIKAKNGAKGTFFATNSFVANSPMQIEVEFEQGKAKYADGNLYINDKLVQNDTPPSVGKKYWGSGHEKLIDNIYSKNIKIGINDCINSMKTMFAIYKSADIGKRISVDNI